MFWGSEHALFDRFYS
ncbi:BnaC01g41800D [Brassica napus]|uniref:BnaC01g41800D protein n=1 Tax=Brassica napus TaxID=3708 RepID=A0A078JAK5_BRANA|nr:BnaC01g41800D [Brassica napus]